MCDTPLDRDGAASAIVRRPQRGTSENGISQCNSHLTCQFSLLFLKQFHTESAVLTGKDPSRRHRALKNAILRCPGLRCGGLGLPHIGSVIVRLGIKTSARRSLGFLLLSPLASDS